MAASDKAQGYQCEFIDSVPEDLFCKKCCLVARKLTVTSCCGESYCHACIADTQQLDKHCPECGEKYFTIYEQVKYQRRIGIFQVYCSVRGRGCDWSGTVEQLDAHLDPDQDNCQHVDIKCPLNCQQTIPKNKVEQHVAKECVKRDYICQHCAFKATYEEVMDTHLGECIYVPLQCPNLCGVTCERHVMEDHMHICHLEEMACKFSDVGCDERFIREDQEEHTRKNIQKHLTLTAIAAVNVNQELQQKLQEQEQKFENLEQKLQRFEELLQKQQDDKLALQESIATLQDKSIENEVAISVVKQVLTRSFKMESFGTEIAKGKVWKSPAMYTHPFGYKFCIGISAKISYDYNFCLTVEIWILKGEYDDQLKWPTTAEFTLELVKVQGGQNKEALITVSLKKPNGICELSHSLSSSPCSGFFIRSYHLRDYLSNDDALYFYVTDVNILL